MVWVGRAWFLVTVFCIQGCATGGKEPVRSTGMLWFGLQPLPIQALAKRFTLARYQLFSDHGCPHDTENG